MDRITLLSALIFVVLVLLSAGLSRTLVRWLLSGRATRRRRK
jgi:hypothetical protein